MTHFYPLLAEIRKNRHSRIVWATFVAFALAPVMGAVFFLILRNPQALAKSGMLNAKAKMVAFGPDWTSYFSLLSQAVGVGGVLIFGFVASWIFGREYSEGTSKDLLSLPTSRAAIVNAKFLTYVLWCTSLAVSNLLIGLVLGFLLNLSGWSEGFTSDNLNVYFITTLLTILAGTPVAFFALLGEGYLAPLGFVALALVFAQIIAATGFGNYFPWSVPGLYSGAAGEYRDQLDVLSYSILILVSLCGYFGSRLWMKYSDQTK